MYSLTRPWIAVQLATMQIGIKPVVRTTNGSDIAVDPHVVDDRPTAILPRPGRPTDRTARSVERDRDVTSA